MSLSPGTSYVSNFLVRGPTEYYVSAGESSRTLSMRRSSAVWGREDGEARRGREGPSFAGERRARGEDEGISQDIELAVGWQFGLPCWDRPGKWTASPDPWPRRSSTISRKSYGVRRDVPICTHFSICSWH